MATSVHGYKQVRVFGGCSKWGGPWGTSAFSSEVAPEDRALLGVDLRLAEEAAGKLRKVDLVVALEALGKRAFSEEKRRDLQVSLINATISSLWPERCRDCGRVLPEGVPEARATRDQGCVRDGWARAVGAAPGGLGEVV